MFVIFVFDFVSIYQILQNVWIKFDPNNSNTLILFSSTKTCNWKDRIFNFWYYRHVYSYWWYSWTLHWIYIKRYSQKFMLQKMLLIFCFNLGLLSSLIFNLENFIDKLKWICYWPNSSTMSLSLLIEQHLQQNCLI